MAGQVFVSGGSGYIAGFLIRQLIAEGWTVHTSIRNLGREAEVRGWLGVDNSKLQFFAADLLGDDGWAEAVAGCSHVAHVASPLPSNAPKDDDELIVPAREGALRALRFAHAAGIDVTLVGYRGAAPALTDAIGGQIDGVCDAAASVSQPIIEKLVKGLVVGANVRLASLPELPTSAEAGLPEFEAQGWNGLFAPKGTPADVIARLNAAAKKAVESEAVRKRFADLSTVAPDAREMAPDVLQQLVTRDVEKFKRLLEEKK